MKWLLRSLEAIDLECHRFPQIRNDVLITFEMLKQNLPGI